MVQDMMAFLGLINFSRHFLPDYAGHTAPLRALMKEQDKAAKEAAGLDLLGMYIMRIVETEQMEDLRPRTLEEWGHAQAQAEWREQQQLEEHGATVEEIGTEEKGQCSLWKGPKGQLVVPNRFLAQMCEEAHGPVHIPPEPKEKPDLIGEEYLLLKVLKRKWQEPRWTGPHRVTARTDTTVRFEGKGDTWYHLSQCAKEDRGNMGRLRRIGAIRQLRVMPLR
ncbi:hypothetical protein D4764_07G0010840 [Takifugu flavidus]|uniref:Murine leukemia virus integrase C-terminal domain-containing protein n=1 Tax=Takifugu flavidus TaxID=433684 RepID=A0A5C6MU29_9TELE|nr:hypothetical protein D4764_07G0010840 [Takifugu flavidus]